MGWKPSRGMTEANRALAGAGVGLKRQAGQLDQDYNQARAFDPSQAYKEMAGGAWSSAQRGLADNLESLAGQGAAMGRLNTGFFDRDQGELIQRTNQDYQDRIAQGALTTAGMQQQQNMGLLNYGQEQQQSYLDLISGQFDREAMLKDKREAGKGGFLKGLAGVANFGAKLAGSAIKGF